MPAELQAASPPAWPDGLWHLRLLGDVRLMAPSGEHCHLPGRAAASLLAQLAMAPDRAQARETLIDQLWPEADLAVGRNRLRQLLSTLKTALRADPGQPQLLIAEGQTLRLQAAALACDVVAFEAAARSGRRTDALALHQDAKQASPVAQLQRLLSGRRTLLVLDNVEPLVDDIGPLLADLLSCCLGCWAPAWRRWA